MGLYYLCNENKGADQIRGKHIIRVRRHSHNHNESAINYFGLSSGQIDPFGKERTDCYAIVT